MKIKLTFKHRKKDDVLVVRFNEGSCKHDIWQNNQYLGAIKLKELLKAGFECVEREFKV